MRECAVIERTVLTKNQGYYVKNIVYSIGILTILLTLYIVMAFGNNNAPTENRDCSTVDFPKKFTIDKKIISFTESFSVESGNTSLGTISKKIISATKSFEYENAKGDLSATAKTSMFSWGTQIDVTDCRDNLLGTIKEQFFQPIFSLTPGYTIYTILGQNGQTLATSEKSEFMKTTFTLKSPDQSLIATIERPMMNMFGDKWTITINKNTIDPRVLMMVGAYKTSSDGDKEDKKKKNSTTLAYKARG